MMREDFREKEQQSEQFLPPAFAAICQTDRIRYAHVSSIKRQEPGPEGGSDARPAPLLLLPSSLHQICPGQYSAHFFLIPLPMGQKHKTAALFHQRRMGLMNNLGSIPAFGTSGILLGPSCLVSQLGGIDGRMKRSRPTDPRSLVIRKRQRQLNVFLSEYLRAQKKTEREECCVNKGMSSGFLP